MVVPIFLTYCNPSTWVDKTKAAVKFWQDILQFMEKKSANNLKPNTSNILPHEEAPTAFLTIITLYPRPPRRNDPLGPHSALKECFCRLGRREGWVMSGTPGEVLGSGQHLICPPSLSSAAEMIEQDTWCWLWFLVSILWGELEKMSVQAPRNDSITIVLVQQLSEPARGLTLTRQWKASILFKICKSRDAGLSQLADSQADWSLGTERCVRLLIRYSFRRDNPLCLEMGFDAGKTSIEQNFCRRKTNKKAIMAFWPNPLYYYVSRT